MTQAAQILSIDECNAIILKWQNEGLTTREYVTKTSSYLLADPGVASDFEEKISRSAELADSITEEFFRTLLALIVASMQIPGLRDKIPEWTALTERWIDCLDLSIQLATELSSMLSYFETILGCQVENIATEEDRLKAIAALECFKIALDTNDRSAEMSRKFLQLKRDVAAFGASLNTLATYKQLSQNIEAFNAQVKVVQDAIGPLGGSLPMHDDAGTIAYNVFNSLLTHRQEKVKALESTNRVPMLAHQARLLSSNPSTTADSSYWPDDLLEFAEIWASVRSQNVQILGFIKGGLSSATNLVLKAHVRLAIETSSRLRPALQEYQRQLTEVWEKWFEPSRAQRI